MKKNINKYKDIRNKILSGLDKVSEPIIGTMTPMGSNVIFEDKFGNPRVTNDGVTIINQIELENPIENNVAQLLKQAALKTNIIAGDGTTTSVLFAQNFVKEGFKLIDNNWNVMNLKKQIEWGSNQIMATLQQMKRKIKSRKELESIALVSSNNDEEIAENVVEAIESAGKDGNILIEDNPKGKTLLKKEEGFVVNGGMFSPLLTTKKGKLEANYKDVKVLVTDKRIYYPNEAIAILKVLMDEGIRNVVIVAKDFIGGAPNVFIANHVQRRINVLLVKDESSQQDTNSLEDLASYLGCEFISDKKGKLTHQLTLSDFGVAKRVLSFPDKTLIYAEKNKAREKRIAMIKEEIRKETKPKEGQELKQRLAKMTSGTITIVVGGKTGLEIQERMYRYEDAVNATRGAKEDGYVVGGGISIYKAFKNTKFKGVDSEVKSLLGKVCLFPLKQIAINCNLHFPTLLSKVSEGDNIGFNAVSEEYQDLLDAGIIEPLLVLQTAWENAVSVGCVILSSQYLITNIKEKNEWLKNLIKNQKSKS